MMGRIGAPRCYVALTLALSRRARDEMVVMGEGSATAGGVFLGDVVGMVMEFPCSNHH